MALRGGLRASPFFDSSYKEQMNSPTVLARLADITAPLATSLGLTVWGLDYAAGSKSLIRVYVEGQEGVDIDRCAELSRLLSLTLDVEDLIPEAYVLEVSSPGLERTFYTAEQLRAYVGKTMELVLHESTAAYPNRKKMTGTLTGEEGGTFTLLPLDAPGPGLEPVPVAFTWDDAKKITLVHFLPETPGTKKGVKRKPA